MYQLIQTLSGQSVIHSNEDDSKTSIPFNLDNTDYQRFKQEINEDKAELQDVEGNVMTAEEAKNYVATLP
jgi:hypothetical protein